MRKSLLAVAVLGAFAANAMAADVTLYGIVDTGLSFSSVKTTGKDRVNKFTMESGQQSGSRWGLKGVEQINDQLSVGFILESGFKSDSGTITNGSGLFTRQSVLQVISKDYGTFGAGRFGGPITGSGSWVDKVGRLGALGSSWGNYNANVPRAITVPKTRADNAMAYVTPKFSGVQGVFYYAMGDSNENKASDDRMAQVAFTYDNGPLALTAGGSYMWYGHAISEDVDDHWSITMGGSYDFGAAKVFLSGQYFDEASLSMLSQSDQAGDLNDNLKKIKGYGVALSASAPLGGGSLICEINYVDAEQADSTKGNLKADFERIAASVGYTYNLSKRTNLYAMVGGGKDEWKGKGETTGKLKATYYRGLVGIRHRF